MALIKLNRINKGGEIVINSDHLIYVELDGRHTTLHLVNGLLFSVEEPIDEVVRKVSEKTGAPPAVSPGAA